MNELVTNHKICQKHFKKIVDYIRGRNRPFEKVKINEKLNTDKFINKVKNSKLENYHKLAVLSIVGKKADYNKYIQPTIELFRQTDDEELKNISYDIIRNVLT